MAPAASFSQQHDLVFDTQLLEAYDLALNLHCQEAREKLPAGENTAEAVYIASLADAIELLITEDYTKFTAYEERFHKRLDNKLKGTQEDFQFVQAEIRLQWAFIYLKFGHEFDAALRLKQAFEIAETCHTKFPDYLPIRKTRGLLQIIVGSVPEKYNWVLSLLNMRGSITTGLAELAATGASASYLAMESQMLRALVRGFILAEPAEAVADMKEILTQHKGNRLVLFLTSALAIKNSQSELALDMLKALTATPAGIPLYYADYLKGEAYLHKGDYVNSLSSFRWFVNNQTGQNYIKDAWYKMGMCYWLNGNENDALTLFEEARNKGKEATEADKSAARSLSEKNLPHVTLTRARYATDGGYYREAKKILSAINDTDLQLKKDHAEFQYRKARLAHKTGHVPEAVEYYLETIQITGQESWYFAPNACLQLGYIYQAQNRIKEAQEYFQRALSYRRHEYKNSIDSKARSALAQLGRI